MRRKHKIKPTGIAKTKAINIKSKNCANSIFKRVILVIPSAQSGDKFITRISDREIKDVNNVNVAIIIIASDKDLVTVNVLLKTFFENSFIVAWLIMFLSEISYLF